MEWISSDRMQVYLSVKDAAYGARQWDLSAADGGLGLVARRVGRRPSGIRHRLPIEVASQGRVLCRIERSRGLKGMAGRYEFRAPEGQLLGTVTRKQAGASSTKPFMPTSTTTESQ